MDETTKVSEQSIPDAQGGRVGDHVHQLLHLARALNHATTVSEAGASSPGVLVGAPFGVELGGLSDLECVGWAQDLERLAHFQQALAVQVAAEITHRTVAGRYSALGVRGPVDMLTQSLKISASEASRRVALADAVFPTPDLITGVLVPAVQPVLGDAFFTGQFGEEQAVIVSKFLAEAGHLQADGLITVEEHHDVETSLVASAATEDPDFLRRIGNRIMTLLDPDGQKPGPAELRAKQGITFRKARRGLVGFSGHLTIEQYEIMLTSIGRFANPNHHKNINPTTSATGTGTGTGADAGAGAGANGGMGDGSDGLVSENSFFTTATDPLTGTLTTFSGAQLGPLWADGLLDPTHNSNSGGSKQSNTGGVGGGMFSFINPSVPEPVTVQQPPLQQPRLWLPPTAVSSEPPVLISPPDPPEPPEPPEPPSGSPPMESLFTAASEPDAVPQSPMTGFGLGVGPDSPESSSPAAPDSSPGTATESSSPAAPDSSTGSDTEGSAWVGWESIWDDSGPLIPLSPEETTHHGEPTDGSPDSDTTTTATTTGAGVGLPGVGLSGGAGWWSSEGVWIPAPGTGEMLEGLDPIDPGSTDRVVADERSYPQKLLDGIIDCLQLAARTGELPLNGGLKAQLIITTSQEDLDRRDGRGTAFTVHSGPVPLSLFDQSLCDPEITRLSYGTGQEILSVGRAGRLFTPAQRKILLARDLGCSFPDCTALAVWCEAHHIIPWQHGGETNINNAALLCSRHHSLLHHTDWSMQLIQGTPFFTAPYLLDPSETPRRNTYHHGLPRPNYPTLRGQGWN